MKKSSINPNYTHFALRKTDNKIVNGWDYRGIDNDDLKCDKNHYFNDDLRDMDVLPSDIKILTKKALFAKSFDPSFSGNWYKLN